MHFGVGIAIGRPEGALLACFPPALALVGPSLDDSLWMALVVLMLFPGEPLIFLRHYVRRTIEAQKPKSGSEKRGVTPRASPSG